MAGLVLVLVKLVRQRAQQALGVLVVAAFVQREQVDPVRRVRLAQHGHADRAAARVHGRQHPVVGDGEARQQVPARGPGAAERVRAAHPRAQLQAAAQRLHVLHPRQLADRVGDQVEGGLRVQRQLDPPLLAVGQHRRVQAPGEQAHPADVGDHAQHRQAEGQQRQQPEDTTDAAEHPGPDEAGHEDGDPPGEQDAEREEQAGGHVGPAGWKDAGEDSGRRRERNRGCDETGNRATKPGAAGAPGTPAGGIHGRDARPACAFSRRWRRGCAPRPGRTPGWPRPR